MDNAEVIYVKENKRRQVGEYAHGLAAVHEATAGSTDTLSAVCSWFIIQLPSLLVLDLLYC